MDIGYAGKDPVLPIVLKMVSITDNDREFWCE
jgi:hypothetical protein